MEELIPLPLNDPKTGIPGTGVHAQDDRAHIKASSNWSGISKLAKTSLTSSCSSNNSTSLSTCWADFSSSIEHGGFGAQLHLRQEGLKPLSLQGFIDFDKVDGVREHLELALVALQVFGAAVQGGLHKLFFVQRLPGRKQ